MYIIISIEDFSRLLVESLDLVFDVLILRFSSCCVAGENEHPSSGSARNIAWTRDERNRYPSISNERRSGHFSNLINNEAHADAAVAVNCYIRRVVIRRICRFYVANDVRHRAPLYLVSSRFPIID